MTLHLNVFVCLVAIIGWSMHLEAAGEETAQFEKPIWLYKDGRQVPQETLETISINCGIEDAMNRVANAKDGEFEAAFEALLAASECFNAYGFKQVSTEEK
ncbi:hypothetical protein [Enterovibrio nigricans]|uniref:Uncharacterized protein n=1 Tax=Enterovibrio nigricans DSM 22720 TaxID=1121868 RepID=A0A1T4V4V1_9GAMM|nr:hypothetical protein [Enterovibrio nigricans]PKF50477.1 hypothetical protein AT251_11350 [Enterovibrio nigricans]SKA59947.1 hypothetical protein SAMN02745132_03212 [Enterovibrio nigricans DSM 22720]